MRVVEGGSPEKEATDGGETKWRWEDKGCWPSDAQLNIMRGSVEVKQGLETFPSLNSVIKWKLLKTGGKTEEKRQRITDGREQQKSAFAIMEKVAAGLPGAARAEAYKRVLSENSEEQGQTPPKRADVGNDEGGQFTVGDDGAAEGGRGLLAASLGDTATTTENAQQPTQTQQPRKKLGSVIFAPLQKTFHIQIIAGAIANMETSLPSKLAERHREIFNAMRENTIRDRQTGVMVVVFVYSFCCLCLFAFAFANCVCVCCVCVCVFIVVCFPQKPKATCHMPHATCVMFMLELELERHVHACACTCTCHARFGWHGESSKQWQHARRDFEIPTRKCKAECK